MRHKEVKKRTPSEEGFSFLGASNQLTCLLQVFFRYLIELFRYFPTFHPFHKKWAVRTTPSIYKPITSYTITYRSLTEVRGLYYFFEWTGKPTAVDT